MVTQRWHDKEFEKRVLDPRIVNFLTRLGLRGEAIAKELISGVLKAVDTGRLRASLTFEVDALRMVTRIGTNVKYAIFVFFGTPEGKPGMTMARPVLRRMLMMLKVEFRG